jgi:hypothetical protein
MKKSISIVLIVIASLLILCIDFNYKASENPNIYYQVYLNGEILGTIKSKSELEKYIDKQNEKYKKEFDVNKIYAPNGLEIKKIETYNDSISVLKKFII